MGLAVSQVRLLALTNRKADIELQMQINSKRKQQLTRKATELSQEYYNRLQNTAIMYATSNGYEDVDFNYVMGESVDGEYTGEFLQDLSTNFTAYGTVHKPENKMILTDSFGQVVVNNTLAKAIAKVYDDSQGQEKTLQEQTISALINLIKDTVSNEKSCSAGFKSIFDKMFSIDDKGNVTTKTEYNDYVAAFQLMIEKYDNNTLDGGYLYQNGSTYYEDVKGTIRKYPKEGYTYKVVNVGTASAVATEKLYINGGFNSAISADTVVAMRNIVEYFAPILSAAFKNGVSMDLSAVSETGGAGKVLRHTADDEHTFFLKCSGGQSLQDCIQSYVNNNDISKFSTGALNYFVVEGHNGLTYYFTASINPSKYVRTSQVTNDISSKFFTGYSVEDGKNAVYENVSKVDKLQSGLKSGTYQFCIVSNVEKGTYHKNTRLNYFTHKGWVSEKMDSSKREEITAWFNVEQAAISEKETYWDTEIQNLSTELTSVNTEIESVKQLKSNAIKSVFNWGNS